jgi:hypothetical protein
VCEVDNLTTLMCRMSCKSGSLNLLEPSEPHRACYWTPLPLPLPFTHFFKRLSRRQGHSAAGRIMSMKNSNDTIGNRTRYMIMCRLVNTCRRFTSISCTNSPPLWTLLGYTFRDFSALSVTSLHSWLNVEMSSKANKTGNICLT